MTTSQQQRILGAIKRVRPTLAQVQKRRPRGFTPREADSLADHLKMALDHLEIAAGLYDGHELIGQVIFRRVGGAR